MYCVQTWSSKNTSCIRLVLKVSTVSANNSTPHSHKRGIIVNEIVNDSYIICPIWRGVISDLAITK